MKTTCPSLRVVLVTIALATSIGCGGGGGGGGSPTAPPPPVQYPQIAGSWTGNWIAANCAGGRAISVGFQMQLSQTAGSVTGIATMFSIPLQVRGTVSPRYPDGNGDLKWEVVPGTAGCGFVSGQYLISDSDSKMQGTHTLDTAGCVDPSCYRGTATLTKMFASSSEVFEETKQSGNLDDWLLGIGKD